jgi:hypothetical protein
VTPPPASIPGSRAAGDQRVRGKVDQFSFLSLHYMYLHFQPKNIPDLLDCCIAV